MKEESLFSLANENESTPLADRVPSLILWGPPGTGKTPLAEIIAKHTKAHFITFSAVTSSIKDIRQIMEEAEQNRQFGEKMILSLSMKSIALIRHNKMPFCPLSNVEALP